MKIISQIPKVYSEFNFVFSKIQFEYEFSPFLLIMVIFLPHNHNFHFPYVPNISCLHCAGDKSVYEITFHCYYRHHVSFIILQGISPKILLNLMENLFSGEIKCTWEKKLTAKILRTSSKIGWSAVEGDYLIKFFNTWISFCLQCIHLTPRIDERKHIEFHCRKKWIM